MSNESNETEHLNSHGLAIEGALEKYVHCRRIHEHAEAVALACGTEDARAATIHAFQRVKKRRAELDNAYRAMYESIPNPNASPGRNATTDAVIESLDALRRAADSAGRHSVHIALASSGADTSTEHRSMIQRLADTDRHASRIVEMFHTIERERDDLRDRFDRLREIVIVRER